ncbi:MAG TPA: hypothetical protein VGI87_00360 [Solirubrobacteraceae bacterium]
MTDQLEQQLRDTFNREADRLPENATAHLRRADYRPRTTRIEPRIALSALGGTALATGATVAVVGLGASAPSAFAGWTATPSRPPAGGLSLAMGTCGKQLPQTSQIRIAPPGSRPTQGPPPGAPNELGGKWSTALTDTRGPYTFAIYTNDRGANVTCFTGPHFSMTQGGVSIHAATTPAPDQIALSGPGPTARGGAPYTLAEGRVGSDVRAVTLVLADGSKVTASIGGGWFLAWWPGATQLSAAEVQTSTGTTTQPLHFPDQRPGYERPASSAQATNAP